MKISVIIGHYNLFKEYYASVIDPNIGNTRIEI